MKRQIISTALLVLVILGMIIVPCLLNPEIGRGLEMLLTILLPLLILLALLLPFTLFYRLAVKDAEQLLEECWVKYWRRARIIQAVARLWKHSRPNSHQVEVTRRGKPGRPSYPEDDWAFREIKAGRDEKEVYLEWLNKIAPERKENLVDPWESFQKALQYRKRQEKK